jgi:hypothetical protein
VIHTVSAQKQTYIEIEKLVSKSLKIQLLMMVLRSLQRTLKVYKDENNIIRLKDKCTWEEEVKDFTSNLRRWYIL